MESLVIKLNLGGFKGVLSRCYDEIKTCLTWLQVSVGRGALTPAPDRKLQTSKTQPWWVDGKKHGTQKRRTNDGR